MPLSGNFTILLKTYDALNEKFQLNPFGLVIKFKLPSTSKPLFLNASVMSDTKVDFNAASSLQMGYRWSTAILGHVSGNFKSFDHNHDGYLDEPEMLQFSLANRWLYYADSGVQVRFGIKALQDSRQGGQPGYDRSEYRFPAAAQGP